jgi:hypothetical protein
MTKLHSIDQYKQKAIIEKFNQLIEVSYANLHGHVMLIDSIDHYEKNGLDAREVYKLVNDHVVATH